MSSLHNPRSHVWAICRLDSYQDDPERAVTILSIVESEAEARRERDRLQLVNPLPETRYFVQETRRFDETEHAESRDLLGELQCWYREQCNGDWEHDKGVRLGTLDNPGWDLSINLQGTDLEHRAFSLIEDLQPASNWLRCWVENGEFKAVGGPNELCRILRIFLDWARSKAAV